MTRGLPSEWRTPVYALVTMVLVMLTAAVWGRIGAASHLRDLDLMQGADIAVSLTFEPERFHIEAFQRVGRYQGWSDGRARIMSADTDALRRLARNYWVRDIEILEAQP